MSLETEAAKTIVRYQKVIKFAAVKASRKWRGYIEAKGHHAPFSYEDINQTAREAILTLAGLIPGSRLAISGTLADLEAQGGERFVQFAVDRYLSSWMTKAASSAARDFRGGGVAPASLDAFEGFEPGHGYGVAVETAEEALTGLSGRFPLLYLTFVEGYERREVMTRTGLSAHAYDSRRAHEVVEFAEWARANRRVGADVEPVLTTANLPKTARKAGECPYGDSACTGDHNTNRGKAGVCPSAWEAKKRRDRESGARHRAKRIAA
jgi:hypothetical protein